MCVWASDMQTLKPRGKAHKVQNPGRLTCLLSLQAASLCVFDSDDRTMMQVAVARCGAILQRRLQCRGIGLQERMGDRQAQASHGSQAGPRAKERGMLVEKAPV